VIPRSNSPQPPILLLAKRTLTARSVGCLSRLIAQSKRNSVVVLWPRLTMGFTFPVPKERRYEVTDNIPSPRPTKVAGEPPSRRGEPALDVLSKTRTCRWQFGRSWMLNIQELLKYEVSKLGGASQLRSSARGILLWCASK